MSTKCRICNAEIAEDEVVCSNCAETADPIILASYGYKTDESQDKSNANISSRRILTGNQANNASANKEEGNDERYENEQIVQTNNSIDKPKKKKIKPKKQGSKATRQQKKSAKTSSSNSGMCLITGVARNVMQDVEKRGRLYRWFRSLFKFRKYNVDPDITQFQIYPDFTGKTKSVSGNVADQVIIHGKIPSGIISDNNNVEVWGRRNRDGVIIANSVKNSATGAVGKPKMCFSPVATWIITLLILALLAFGIATGILFVIIGIILFIIFLPWILRACIILFGLVFKGMK